LSCRRSHDTILSLAVVVLLALGVGCQQRDSPSKVGPASNDETVPSSTEEIETDERRGPDSDRAQTLDAGPPRKGLLHTQDEVRIWQRRAKEGPYRLPGDVSENSPGDWGRIEENADTFLHDPPASRWEGPSQGDLATCVQQGDDSPPSTESANLRDAAFAVLVLGEEATPAREAVKQELLWQATYPGTDFGNRSRWCSGILWDVGPSFPIAHWLTKLLLAYDYLGEDAFTIDENRVLTTWFREAAEFFQADLDTAMERTFVERGADAELSASVLNDPLCDRVHYLGSPPSCGLHRRYNNRHASIARFISLVGVHQDDENLQKSGQLFVEEFLRYGVFSEGFASDFERWTDQNPDLGWAYGAATVGSVLTIAESFARAGNHHLYEYRTSGGALGSQGGNKSLLFAAQSIGRHSDGTFERYGTDNPEHHGDPNYLIDGSHAMTNWFGVHEIFFAMSNSFFQDAYLQGSYLRTNAGMSAYPDQPAPGSPDIWMGEGGIFPGVLFMYGQTEHLSSPYEQEIDHN
jgi:hypothetical protein